VAEPFAALVSATVIMPAADVDTDQIIPARFLTTTEREGLGALLFHDVRASGGIAEVLEDPRCKDAAILVVGDNFGCGSSREHAPWALHDFGFRVVVSTSFADIFTSNALKNGLLPVVVPEAVHSQLLQQPWAKLSVDLEASTLTAPDGQVVSFTVEPFARFCLLRGIDPLDFLLDQSALITAFEGARS
jgi:3-isopropylmalate/(R)-2-methylmalate dehydratase small subunit